MGEGFRERVNQLYGGGCDFASLASPFGEPCNYKLLPARFIRWSFCFSYVLTQASLARPSEKQKSRSRLRE